MQRMQASLNMWEGGLRATGGAIVPDKSHWYLIKFLWDARGKVRYATPTEEPATLRVKGPDGVTQTLQRLHPKEARRTLGVRLSLDGNNNDEVQYRLTQAHSWADSVRTGRLPRSLAWLSLTTSVLQSLLYPLPATTFTKVECARILRPVLLAGLPACGIARNFPRALVHAPLRFQGLNIPCLWVSQGVAHITHAITHCQSSTITGQLLRTSLEALILELGMPGSPFTMPITDVQPFLTKSWWTHTWVFLTEFQLSIHTPEELHLPLLRSHDRFIMDMFLQAGFKGESLARLQRCRLHLQVLTLADIVDGYGAAVCQWAFEGARDLGHSFRSHYVWPKQPKPAASEWIHWKGALVTSLRLQTSNLLPVEFQLGPWIQFTTPWQYEPTTDRIYHRSPHGWQFFSRIHSQRAVRYPRFLAIPTFGSPSAATFNCTILSRGTSFLMTGYSTSTKSSTPARSPDIFHRLSHPSPTAKWACHSIDLNQDFHALLVSLRTGGAIAVSDGSYANGAGTAAWIVTDQCNSISGLCVLPGSPSYHNSFRSELGGIYGILHFLWCLEQSFPGEPFYLAIYCDGLEAVKKASCPLQWARGAGPQYDLLSAIWKFRHELRSHLSFHHVKGHQSLPYEELDFPSKMNHLMDTRAKAFLRSKPHSPPPAIFYESWTVFAAGEKVSGDLKSTLEDYCGMQNLYWWWQDKGRGQYQHFAHIDWKALERTMTRLPIPRRHWIAKHAAGICGVGTVLKKWKWQDNDLCPLCHEREDAAHVWACRSASSLEVWETSVQKLSDWMEASHTYPQLRHTICECLRAWKQGYPPNPPSSTAYPSLRDAWDDQSFIGWSAFIEGRVSTFWADTQQQFFLSLRRQNTGHRWVASLIKKLLEVAWDQWEHRCGSVHRQEATAHQLRINNTVEDLLQAGPGKLKGRDRRYFMFPNRVRSYPTSSKEGWIMNVEAAFRRQDQRDAQHRQGQQAQRALMHRWLATAQR